MKVDITQNEQKMVRDVTAYVESESKGGMFYKVTFSVEERWKCTCPQFENRKKECKHIEATKGGI